MEDVLNLWDGIFAKDPSLNIVIFIGLALLLKIRDDCKLIGMRYACPQEQACSHETNT